MAINWDDVESKYASQYKNYAEDDYNINYTDFSK